MESEKKQVVILGAGYGGLRTALRLERLIKQNPDWQILLIDRYSVSQLKTELHEAAAGKLSFEDVSVSISKLIVDKNIEFLQAEATNIDFKQQVVTTSKGKIKYDKLVIALGSETEFFDIPGLKTQAFTLASVDDALKINTHIRNMFAQAKKEIDSRKRQATLTFVVGGGGYTGIELATELFDYTQTLSRQFDILQEDIQLMIIEAENRILPGFDAELADYTQKILKEKGIRLMLKTPCVSAEDDVISLKTGEKISARTLIWTGGVRACELVEQAESEQGLKYGSRGRLIVNQYLESVDHHEVYVIGDSALIVDPISNRPLAPSAQLALQQAEVAATNIAADIKSLKRVRYAPKVAGEFVSLGRRNAVGWVWRFKVTGFVAWSLKRFSAVRYLYSLGGLRLVIPRLRRLLF